MAALSVSAVDTPVVANFDSTIAGVYRFAGDPKASGAVLSEPDGWVMQGETGRFGFDSRSWHITTSSQAYDKFTAPFPSNINSNATTDDRFDLFQEQIVRLARRRRGQLCRPVQ